VSVASLPPTRAVEVDGAAATGLADLIGSVVCLPGAVAVAGLAAAVRLRVGGGGGGGLAGGRVELVIVGAVFTDAVGGEPVPRSAVRAVDADLAGDADTATPPPLLEPFAAAASFFVCLPPEPLSAKKSRQMGSTLAGSARNCWYFSSTNQSLGPNSGTAADDTVGFRLFSYVKGGQSRLNLVRSPRTVGRRGVTHYRLP
jgi:hypothetical protein